MLILKKKHDLVVENYESRIVHLHNMNANRLEKIESLQKSLANEMVISKNKTLETVEKTKCIEKLEVLNCKLNVEKTVIVNELNGAKKANLDLIKGFEEKRKQVNKLENANNELNQELGSYQNRVKELEFCNQEAKKEIGKLKRLLTVNEEAKRQIRDRCLFKDNQGRYVKNENGEVLVNEKVDGLKIWDLTVLMGE